MRLVHSIVHNKVRHVLVPSCTLPRCERAVYSEFYSVLELEYFVVVLHDGMNRSDSKGGGGVFHTKVRQYFVRLSDQSFLRLSIDTYGLLGGFSARRQP